MAQRIFELGLHVGRLRRRMVDLGGSLRRIEDEQQLSRFHLFALLENHLANGGIDLGADVDLSTAPGNVRSRNGHNDCDDCPDPSLLLR